MAWTVTVTSKNQTVDGLTIGIHFDNNSGVTFDKSYTTADTTDANFFKNEAKKTLTNVKAMATYASNFNVNDTFTGIGN